MTEYNPNRYKVFIIVVTYNAVTWIDRCFGSLKNTSIPLKIIAVDNNSADNTPEILRFNYPEVELLQLKKNLGFGKANNIGIRKALNQGADYIFLLNQDAWTDPKTIEGLIRLHASHPGFGIFSPIHLNGSGDALDYRFSLTCNETNCPGFVSDLYLKKNKDVYEITFANAAFWLISKECITKAGLFDPIFPHYGEDTDYVNRIKYHGFKIGIVPGYFGFHDREKRQPSEKRDRAIIDLGYICSLKDVNRPFLYSFLGFFSFFITSAFKKVFKGNMVSVLNDFKFFSKLMISIPQILKARRICKKPSAYL